MPRIFAANRFFFKKYNQEHRYNNAKRCKADRLLPLLAAFVPCDAVSKLRSQPSCPLTLLKLGMNSFIHGLLPLQTIWWLLTKNGRMRCWRRQIDSPGEPQRLGTRTLCLVLPKCGRTGKHLIEVFVASTREIRDLVWLRFDFLAFIW